MNAHSSADHILAKRGFPSAQRCRDIIAATPFGGSYSERMRKTEVALVREYWLATGNGYSSFASTVRLLADREG